MLTLTNIDTMDSIFQLELIIFGLKMHLSFGTNNANLVLGKFICLHEVKLSS